MTGRYLHNLTTNLNGWNLFENLDQRMEQVLFCLKVIGSRCVVRINIFTGSALLCNIHITSVFYKTHFYYSPFCLGQVRQVGGELSHESTIVCRWQVGGGIFQNILMSAQYFLGLLLYIFYALYLILFFGKCQKEEAYFNKCTKAYLIVVVAVRFHP